MTVSQAVKKLEQLGFSMSTKGKVITGTMEPESFNYYPHKILSKPLRDVFVGETAKGWHITSHINFKGIRHRSWQPHYATILNICGSGNTLQEAMDQFTINFDNKTYNQYDSVMLEGKPIAQ